MKILADENMPMVTEIFAEFGEVSLCAGREMHPEQVKEADLLLVRSITQVDEALLAGSQVKFVGTATIGTDHIDQTYLQAREVGFSNAPGCNAEAVVDYVLSAVFQMAEQQGFNPAERTYGIVGVGNVGERLQQRLQRCGFRVLLNDPPRAQQESGFVDLDTLLKQADFICLHTPLTREGEHASYHLFDAEKLQRLQQGTILLNAGRGPVIDNTALAVIAEQRSDLSFVLDVWEHEPAVDPVLAEYCSFISPHIAGYSLEGKIRGTYMLYEAYCAWCNRLPSRLLSDFMPLAQLTSLEQAGQSPLQLMQQVYDIRTDDALLRKTLLLPENEQKKAFDQLRKNYRVRREFSSLTIQNPDQPELLAGIGFQLAEPGELP